MSASMVAFVHDGKPMSVPDPRDPHSVEDRLRSGAPTLDDMLYAAAVLAAYRQLFRLPQQARNRLVRQAKEAMGWPATVFPERPTTGT